MKYFYSLVMYILLLKTLFILAFASEAWGDSKCKEQLTKSGFVCACNSEYCDTRPETPQLQFGSVYKITTGKKIPGFNKKVIQFSEKKYPRDSNIIVVNDKKEYQKLKGFGGSFSDAFGANLLSLSEKTREVLLRSYFGKDGLRYSLCRVPIGATDFSLNGYTYDNVVDDMDLAHFKLDDADFRYKIPFIKRAREIGNNTLDLVACNWSPPEWMKVKTRAESSYLKDEYFQVFTDYLTRFFLEYKKSGVEFWGLTPSNEPVTGFALHLAFFNVIMPPEKQAILIGQHIGPTLKSKGLGDIKIIGLDDQRKYLPWWMDIVMADKDARDYVSGVGLHWYEDLNTTTLVLDETHAKYPDKFFLNTEASINLSFTFFTDRLDFGSWVRGALYAYNIIQNLNHWSIGWIDWNMALDMQGGPNWIKGYTEAPVLVDKDNDLFYKQPMFYLLGHFSTFTSENSTRIELLEFNMDRIGQNLNYVPSFGWPTPFLVGPVAVPMGVEKTAVKNVDGSTTIFLLNTYPYEVDVTIIDRERGYLYLNLEPESMNSYIYW